MLEAKNFFLENPALSRTTSYGFLATCQNLEKTNDTIPRKCLDGRTDGGREDGQTLFHRTLPATARVQLNLNFNLKVCHKCIST